MAAQRASGDQRQQISELAEAMIQTANDNDTMQFVSLEYRYHQLLAEAADNRFSARMLNQLNNLSLRFWHHHRQAGNLELVARLHVNVATGIAAEDIEAAQTAAAKHMDYIFAFTRSTINLETAG